MTIAPSLLMLLATAQAAPAAKPAAPAPAVMPPVAVSSASELLAKGKFLADFRLRYEGVDDDGFADSADALTLRARLGFRTAAINGFSAYAETQSLLAAVDDYNSTANGRTNLPVIPDPKTAEFSQAYLAWGFATPTQLIAGRQRIALDNQRFFGNVGFRQIEQTFDAVSFSTARSGLTFRMSWLDKVHRIFGNQNPNPLLRQQDLNAWLLNTSYQFQPDAGRGLAGNTLTGYGYFVENEDLKLTSSRTLGVRYVGGWPINERTRAFYTLEFAQQDDYRGGSAAIDANYSLLEAGLSLQGGLFSVKIAQETLGGDGRYGFQTPFATLHAFNGWADRFLTTPATGLVDVFLDGGVKLAGGQLNVQWHEYESDTGSIDYGSEWGLQYVRPINANWTATVKYANYSADRFARDVHKLWLFVDLKY